jgi:hypothetical protein
MDAVSLWPGARGGIGGEAQSMAGFEPHPMRSALSLAALLLAVTSAGCASAPKPPPQQPAGLSPERTLDMMRAERELIRALGANGLAFSVTSNARIELLVGLAKADIAARLGAPELDQGARWGYAFFHERAGGSRTLALDFDPDGRCTAASWVHAD